MIRNMVLVAALSVGSAYALPRMQVTGNLGEQSKSTAPAKVEGSIVAVARVIAPTGWRGYASKAIDVNRQSSVVIQQGEQWSTSFERWLIQERLVAKVDATKKLFLLDHDSSAVGQTVAIAPNLPVATSPDAGANSMRWEVRIEDVKLENTLKRWAQKANYQLIWDTDREFLIPATDVSTGTFEDALNRLLQSPAIRNSDHPLEAVIYANSPPLVRITRLGDK